MNVLFYFLTAARSVHDGDGCREYVQAIAANGNRCGDGWGSGVCRSAWRLHAHATEKPNGKTLFNATHRRRRRRERHTRAVTSAGTRDTHGTTTVGEDCAHKTTGSSDVSVRDAYEFGASGACKTVGESHHSNPQQCRCVRHRGDDEVTGPARSAGVIPQCQLQREKDTWDVRIRGPRIVLWAKKKSYYREICEMDATNRMFCFRYTNLK